MDSADEFCLQFQARKTWRRTAQRASTTTAATAQASADERAQPKARIAESGRRGADGSARFRRDRHNFIVLKEPMYWRAVHRAPLAKGYRRTVGSSGSWPPSVRNSRATSRMVRDMGPIAPRTENGPTQGGKCPRPGKRPGDGLKEQMPVKCAGTRTEPPLSEQSLPRTFPPQWQPTRHHSIHRRALQSHGFDVRPCRRFAVSYAIRYSGQLVVPRISAPAFLRRPTTTASSVGISPLRLSEPISQR